MIHKIKNKREALRLLCGAFARSCPPPVFDLDENLDPDEIPINVRRCPKCWHNTRDTLEDVLLNRLATDCPECGTRFVKLISVELIVQGDEVLFKRY